MKLYNYKFCLSMRSLETNWAERSHSRCSSPTQRNHCVFLLTTSVTKRKKSNYYCGCMFGGFYNALSTILTSERELILRTYIVIPTSTGVPGNTHHQGAEETVELWRKCAPGVCNICNMQCSVVVTVLAPSLAFMACPILSDSFRLDERNSFDLRKEVRNKKLTLRSFIRHYFGYS